MKLQNVVKILFPICLHQAKTKFLDQYICNNCIKPQNKATELQNAIQTKTLKTKQICNKLQQSNNHQILFKMLFKMKVNLLGLGAAIVEKPMQFLGQKQLLK